MLGVEATDAELCRGLFTISGGEGGDFRVRTLLRDLDRSLVLDEERPREERSSGLRDILLGKRN